MAEEKYLESQTGRRVMDPIKGTNQQSEVVFLKEPPKVPLASKQDKSSVKLDKDLKK